MRLDRLEAQIRQLTGAIEQLQYRNQQLEEQVRRTAGGHRVPLPGTGRQGRSRVRAGSPAGRLRRRLPPRLRPGEARRRLRPHAESERAGRAARARRRRRSAARHRVGRAAGRRTGRARRGRAARSCDAGTARAGRRSTDSAAGATRTRRAAPDAEGRIRPRLRLPACARTTRWPKTAFARSCRTYPNDRLAPEATYWLGESLFQRQRYRDAAEAFLNVTTKYDTPARAPDALFRLGQSLAALGETEAACASLGEVVRKFPRASASVKQGVEREQKRVRC